MADDDSRFPARGMEPKDWQKIKSEIYRLYIVVEDPLESVRAQLQAIHGFQACISIWKKKVKEWNFSKNFPAPTMHAILAVRAQRAQKRKRTVFSCEGTPIIITQERIDNFAKRKKHCGAAPPFVPALPSNIRYYTPNSEDECDASEEVTHGKFLTSLSTSTQVPSSSLGHACSACSQQWDMEPGESYRIELPDDPEFSLLGSIDRWSWDEHQPWSHFRLPRQPNCHHDTVVDDHNLSDGFKEYELPSAECNVWPDVPNNLYRPFLESRSIFTVEQEDGVSEEVEPKDPSILADKLRRYLRENREYTPHALTVHFELAETLIEIGKFDEAEDHCHILRAIDSQQSVAALLGKICARTDRLEESTTWFFIALADFILVCTECSSQQIEQPYWRLYYLLAELLWMVEQAWTPLTNTMEEMMATLKGLRSDEDLQLACPELFTHGFHFAHKCAVLNLINSAKHLYQSLLEPSTFYLNGRHLVEKAKAHELYGLLLSGEEDWSSSAEQLLLACESIIQSGSCTHQYAAYLTNTFNDLRLHLPSENDTAGSTMRTIGTKLEYMKNQISFSHNNLSFLPVENYLQSNLPGLHCSILLANMSAQAQLTLPVRSIVNSQGRTDSNPVRSRRGTVSDDGRVSKTKASSGPMSSSMSGDGSHENGQTWPISEWDEYSGINGICEEMS